MRLASIAVENWLVLDGYAAAHGMPELADLSLSRFCSYIWHMMTRNEEENEVRKIEARLWRPPVGEEAPKGSIWSSESEQSIFSALKQQVGAGSSIPVEGASPV